LPDESLWFSTGLLRGTAYDADNRLHRLKTLRVVRLEDKAAFRSIAPWDYWVVWAYIWKLGEQKPALGIVQQEASELMKYDSRLLESLLLTWPNDVELYRAVGRQQCELDSGEWSGYADHLVDLGDDAGALYGYRQMLLKSSDRANVSNNLDWLIDYEFEHGNEAEALRLARWAAATGSGGGYRVLARQLELRGDLKGAAKALGTLHTRYADPADLLALYLRHRQEFRGSPVEFDVEPLVAKLFPSGLEPLPTGGLVGPPTDGALVLGPYKGLFDRLKGLAIEPGAIVVGVNGTRVRNFAQYDCLRRASVDPALGLVLWQGGSYVSRRATFRDRALNAEMRDYLP
jgi:hypothetical protein